MCITIEKAIKNDQVRLLHLSLIGAGFYNNKKTLILKSIVIAILGIELVYGSYLVNKYLEFQISSFN